MSFQFSFPSSFSESFIRRARDALEDALNSGGKLPLVDGRIKLKELFLGSIAPELDLLGIDEMTADGTFQGRFMLSYAGDAFISLAADLHVGRLSRRGCMRHADLGICMNTIVCLTCCV